MKSILLLTYKEWSLNYSLFWGKHWRSPILPMWNQWKSCLHHTFLSLPFFYTSNHQCWFCEWRRFQASPIFPETRYHTRWWRNSLPWNLLLLWKSLFVRLNQLSFRSQFRIRYVTGVECEKTKKETTVYWERLAQEPKVFPCKHRR